MEHVELDEFLVRTIDLLQHFINRSAVHHRRPQRSWVEREEHPGERPHLRLRSLPHLQEGGHRQQRGDHNSGAVVVVLSLRLLSIQFSTGAEHRLSLLVQAVPDRHQDGQIGRVEEHLLH